MFSIKFLAGQAASINTSLVRRPDDDRISRSKHVASHTINNNKTVVLDVYFN